MFEKIDAKPITEIAKSTGLNEDEIEVYGKYIAKVDINVLERLKEKNDAKYIDVTAITPTPFGEGKTVTTIGLGMALNKIGKKTINTLREPSMGPVFGTKGGGTGGGASSLVPMEAINLHFTGDTHAVESATNLLAAIIDNHIKQGNSLRINPSSIFIRRTLDVEDRNLRRIITGVGEDGVLESTGFDIAASSPIMAILGLSLDFKDLKERLKEIIVAKNYDGSPVFVQDLKAEGVLIALLKDVLYPNLVQTSEGTPVFVHIGPFANIAFGNNSVIADKIALKLADFVVTESGFGADMGFEKLVDLKIREGSLKPPDTVVLVSTVRALKMHGGAFNVKMGKELDDKLVATENYKALEKGLENLKAQIENVLYFNIPVIVAINRFPNDKDEEIKMIKEYAIQFKAKEAISHTFFKDGAAGGIELAEIVSHVALNSPTKDFNYLYPLDETIENKIRIIAQKMYKAQDISLTPLAKRKIKEYEASGYGKLPICIAKTQLSISHDQKLKGVPTGYIFPIIDVRLASGARFIYPLAGEIQTMPGLPKQPQYENISIDDNGNIIGLK